MFQVSLFEQCLIYLDFLGTDSVSGEAVFTVDSIHLSLCSGRQVMVWFIFETMFYGSHGTKVRKRRPVFSVLTLELTLFYIGNIS